MEPEDRPKHETNDPVNRTPFDSLRTRFSEAIHNEDLSSLHEIEVEAGRLIQLLQGEVQDYENMIKNCGVEAQRIKDGQERGSDGEGS